MTCWRRGAKALLQTKDHCINSRWMDLSRPAYLQQYQEPVRVWRCDVAPFAGVRGCLHFFPGRRQGDVIERRQASASVWRYAPSTARIMAATISLYMRSIRPLSNSSHVGIEAW